MKRKNLLVNNRGFFHLHLLTITFFSLALVGGWFIYTSYKQNRLSANMTQVLSDYKSFTLQAVTNAPDRAKIEKNLQEINQIISQGPGIKYSKPSKSFYDLDYPYSQK